MRRFLIPVILLSALIALFAAACSAEPEVIVEERIVEVEKEVVREVEVEVEKIVEKEVIVEVEKLVEVVVETEKILVATPTPDIGSLITKAVHPIHGIDRTVTCISIE